MVLKVIASAIPPTNSAFAIPISIFLFCAVFTSIPGELEEAGIIDGFNIYQVFLKIVLPIVKPVMATVAIMNFLKCLE